MIVVAARMVLAAGRNCIRSICRCLSSQYQGSSSSRYTPSAPHAGNTITTLKMRLLLKLRSRFAALCLCAILLPFSVFVLLTKEPHEPSGVPSKVETDNKPVVAMLTSQAKVNFDKFNNETGVDHFIVPNIVHFVRFNRTSFSFAEYICVLAAYIHQKPEKIYFHTDLPGFDGKYWDKMKKIQDLYSRIELKPAELPAKIFGQNLSQGWRLWHGSDIARIRTVMKYGGIYLDNDIYVVQNLDRYRKFEIAMGWDQDQFLGSQVIIAHKDARFLPMWLDTYREYRADRWYYNAGERPTTEVLHKRPELLHRVKLKFGVHMLIQELFSRQWKEWRDQHSVHLLMGHRSYLDPNYKKYPDFNETVIQTYNYTFGEMARDVLQYFETPH